jgi:hypothetical protein
MKVLQVDSPGADPPAMADRDGRRAAAEPRRRTRPEPQRRTRADGLFCSVSGREEPPEVAGKKAGSDGLGGRAAPIGQGPKRSGVSPGDDAERYRHGLPDTAFASMGARDTRGLPSLQRCEHAQAARTAAAATQW